jgi:type IX secretion system substrate protein
MLWTMAEQLLNQSKVSPKMLAKGIFAGSLLFLFSGASYGQSVSFGVEFGTPQSNGGPCVGRGSCEQVYDFNTSTGVYVSDPNAVSVVWTVMPVVPAPVASAVDTVATTTAGVDSVVAASVPVNNSDNNVLTMRFSLSELTNKQPDQVAYFTDPSQTYQFDATCPLTGPIFSGLGLLPDACIKPTDATSVAIDGDMVVVTIHYSYTSGKMSNGNSLVSNPATNNSTVSPNPATDNIVLNVKADDKISSYMITNLVGQVVSQDLMSGTVKNISISSLPKGMYLVNLFSGDHKTETIKFVKQ